jgi:protein SCO1/2
MRRKLLGVFLLVLALLVSFGVMFAPTLFTKNVSRIEINQNFELERILSDEKKVELLFFGYAGCADICSPRLASLAAFYEGLAPKTKSALGLRFIDISSPGDKTLSQRFAEYFHKDFVGVYLEGGSLREYTKLFGVFFAPSLSEAMEFDHTAHLYLVGKKGNVKKIHYVYSAYPYDFSQIQQDIEELINE